MKNKWIVLYEKIKDNDAEIILTQDVMLFIFINNKAFENIYFKSSELNN